VIAHRTLPVHCNEKRDHEFIVSLSIPVWWVSFFLLLEKGTTSSFRIKDYSQRALIKISSPQSHLPSRLLGGQGPIRTAVTPHPYWEHF